MSEEDQLKRQLEATALRVRQLEKLMEAAQKQTAQILEVIETQDTRLAAQESSVARLDRILMELLTGRTWRALRATGELVKRVLPGRVSAAESVALTKEKSYLKIDEPKRNDRSPRTGEISIRGWALAERGVDSIQIEVPGLPPIETTTDKLRPDVKKTHPDLDQTGRSGFSVRFDSTQLSPGFKTITLRLISKGVVIRETRAEIVLNHERGYSSDYHRWITEFENPDDRLMELKLASLNCRPRFSILMAVYNTEPAELDAAIQSVLAQSYTSWQLCVTDDGSTRAGVHELLHQYADQDERIQVKFQEKRGGISAALNAAWPLATGDFIAFLDHDDTLSTHALAYVCNAIEQAPEVDFLYSDEDKIDRSGKRYDPFFKPDWSPDLILSENYICHLLVLRKDLAEKIGRFDSACDGSQDYDLILKASEQAYRIEHIPKVLYHWRASVGSTATTIENKQYALGAAQEALRRHCARTGKPMRITPSDIVGRWRMRYDVPADSHVSIIIPSGGKENVLRTNLRSLFNKTTYSNFEVVIIDNSRGANIEKLISEFKRSSQRLRYIDWRNKPFNYSAINNEAARQCESPILLFLNDDTSVLSSEWLEAMVELVMRPEVGAVGAKLLYPDGRIQHAGVVMGIYDNCGHAFKGLDGSARHYFDFSDVIRNVSAVTGACLMTKSDVFWKVGGFDEEDFAVAFNDIDLCLKIGALGYRVLYTPHALLHHHEAFSKTSKDVVPHPDEVAAMRVKWEKVILQDPFYSPNLTRNDEDYSLRIRG